MAHKFNPKHMHMLDNPDRRVVFPPNETLKKLGLESTDVLVDIGAGIGYFTIPSLDITSKVFALDTSEDMLIALKTREMELTGKNQIQTILTDEYDLKLAESVATFALMVNVLHEIDDKKRFINEIMRILTEHGKLAIIDWNKVEMPSGPPVMHRISIVETESLLIDLDFKIDKTMTFGDSFYGIVAIK